jgi:hypothetical protein
VQVALERWRKLTGEDPYRASDGKLLGELQAEAG